MNDGPATNKDKYDVDKIDIWHRSRSIEQEACQYFTDGMNDGTYKVERSKG